MLAVVVLGLASVGGSVMSNVGDLGFRDVTKEEQG